MIDAAADLQTEAQALAHRTAEYKHATTTATIAGRIFTEAQRCVKPRNGTKKPSTN